MRRLLPTRAALRRHLQVCEHFAGVLPVRPVAFSTCVSGRRDGGLEHAVLMRRDGCVLVLQLLNHVEDSDFVMTSLGCTMVLVPPL
jgi:hypothetical protein